jgi:predicted transcriptional regulator
MTSTDLITLRLDSDLRKQLDKLAKAQRRSRSFVAAEAIRDYVVVNHWQIEEIHKGLQEADRGDFASAADLERVISRWTGSRHKRPAGVKLGRQRRARRAR